jgi:hypothetical protein
MNINHHISETPEMRLHNDISAMYDSVNLINELIATNEHSDKLHDTIKRNVDHLSIMLTRQNIIDNNTGTTDFNTAITNGNLFIDII